MADDIAITTDTAHRLEALRPQLRFEAGDAGMCTGLFDPVERAASDQAFTNLIDTLVAQLPHLTKSFVLEQFQKTLRSLPLSDTEDRERAAAHCEKIMDVLGIGSSDGVLNNWMYGPVLGNMLNKKSPMANDVLLGVVIGAQGLKGEVKVKTFTGTPERLGAYGALHTKDTRRFTVLNVRVAKDVAVVRFEGIVSRETAESLKGIELYIARSALPPGEPHEFYHADLIGLRAEDEVGRSIGKVIAIHNFGAGDVIEIEREDGGGAVLMPFTREIVPTIDIHEGRIVIAAPEEVEAETKGNVE
jgi:16S rRNA processing protein RimM